MVFTGIYSPGLSPTIALVENVTFAPTSTLIMEFGGTVPGSGYDQIQSTGTLVLGGALQLVLIDGFVPAAGQTFDLFNGPSVVGAFSSVQLPAVAGLSWNASQLAAGILRLQITGDYNGDGTVDAADYTVWRDSLGRSGMGLAADGDGNGVIDQADYNLWKSNFGSHDGNGAGLSARESVPESNPVTLSLIGLTILLIFRAGFPDRCQR